MTYIWYALALSMRCNIFHAVAFLVLLTCQKVKLWMLWESICFSVIRIGCKHFWEVWLKFEHIYQIRLSKIQCNAAAGSFKYGLYLCCYNFSFFCVWMHWKSTGKKSSKVSKNCQFAILKKSPRRGSQWKFKPASGRMCFK